MKMNFRRLAMTAVLLSGTSMAFADQGASSAVGDLPGYDENAYFGDESDYAESNYVAPAAHAERSAVRYATRQSPHQSVVGVSELQPASFGLGHGSNCDATCGCESPCGGACSTGYEVGCGMGYDGGYVGGCDSGRGSRKKLCNVFDSCDSDTWAQAEFLMWFVQDRNIAPLVTVSDPGTVPTLNEPSTQVVFGGNLEGELSAGFRMDYGKWITDNVGIGGRFWILAENNDSISLAGDGTGNSIGRPFYHGAIADEDALLINGQNIGSGNAGFAGSVAADDSLDIMGAEAYSRIRFSCAKNCRLDFIGGFSHFDIDNELKISSETINVANPATGRTRTFSDFFETQNRFNGGQLGFEMVITRGRWMARSLTKVHLGNMQQQVSIAGVSTDFTPGGPPATITSGGLLAQGQQGQYERDVFAFAPEANFKLAYKFRRNVMLSAGYSFIYWDNVILTGDVVDPIITDASQLNTGTFGPRPAFAGNDSSLWVQGIDLGVVIDF